jgi:hypothetical protein
MERGKFIKRERVEPATIEDFKHMEYAGGGYFREKKPIGVTAKIIHAPEMKRMLLEEIDRLKAELYGESESP